ncbi:MAG TPA: hypothetical protein VMM92_04890, partial [Thermoanaerobaculia bacterium]|nr:hypothetical protein [Thermoanaerobaculia bacterium]
TGTLYIGADAGLFKSVDGAVTIGPIVGVPHDRLPAVVVDPTDPDKVYAGSLDPTLPGLYRSADGGATWTVGRTGLHGMTVSPPLFAPTNPAIAYLATDSGLFSSNDGGSSWSLTLPSSALAGLHLFAVDPGDPEVLYGAGIPGFGASLLRSVDGGAHWSAFGSGLPGSIGSLVFDPQNPAIVYVSAIGLYRSADHGATFVPASGDIARVIVNAVVPVPSNPATVYAAVTTPLFKPPISPPFSLFKSTDRGLTWVRDDLGFNLTEVDHLAVDPHDPQTLYATSAGQLFRSRDGGGSWSAGGSVPPISAIVDLKVDPVQPGVLYAATSFSGIFFSPDEGTTWIPLSRGLPTLQLTGLALDPNVSGKLYVATSGFGLQSFSPPVPHCSASATALCLQGGRFRVEAVWKDFQGRTGTGQAVPLSPDTGSFWFFAATNLELMVKVLDGRPLNERFWFFYGALSNVEYTLTVTDTATGAVKTYHNPLGNFASQGDTQAF